MTKRKTHLTLNTDLAGWWIVRKHEGYPDDSHPHAVADPCPLNDEQCRLDRKAVNRLMVRHGETR